MMLHTLALAALFATTIAVPYAESSGDSSDSDDGSDSSSANYEPCPPGLIGSYPQCCSVDILNILSLNCKPVPRTPTSAADFKDACASVGGSPECCTVPLATLGVLCEASPGTS